ncbi:hypothetical protein CFK37_17015 [Virgibacillus phasianinus]|uniref:DUF2512 domain-containing protein n=1 Tax=Virgibacillus phasianinus TaxID=2017483 RepID=A0A220U772_9BACI|nr:YndM family protein [Virgibacillus phasianinus]ASK63736.1 hypothetical protein CFK37_17015 [Virgibacillus phasianinus]
MEHLKGLITKFVLVTAVLFVVLSLFYGVDFGDVLLISLVLTGISYLGDMYVLPNTSNTVATLADLGLSFIIVWLFGGSIIEENIPIILASIISAVIISICEVFFHIYMERHVLEEDAHNTAVSGQRFSTEFSSDEPDVKKEYQKSLEDNETKE